LFELGARFAGSLTLAFGPGEQAKRCEMPKADEAAKPRDYRRLNAL
jgi:hypothetical protein